MGSRRGDTKWGWGGQGYTPYGELTHTTGSSEEPKAYPQWQRLFTGMVAVRCRLPRGVLKPPFDITEMHVFSYPGGWVGAHFEGNSSFYSPPVFVQEAGLNNQLTHRSGACLLSVLF